MELAGPTKIRQEATVSVTTTRDTGATKVDLFLQPLYNRE